MGRFDDIFDVDLVEKVRVGNKVVFGEFVEFYFLCLFGLVC